MASAACVTDLQQNQDRSWSGRAVKTGEIKKFHTLEDYNQYTKSLEQQGTYCPNTEAQYIADYKPGKNTTPSGFLEFQARDPGKQVKYSAMSPTWEGIESSEAAIARGDYDLDRAEKNRKDLRSKRPEEPLPPQPVEPSWNCSIQ